jgi:hypothetical protein
MRKRIVNQSSEQANKKPVEQDWLDIEDLVEVEISSEDNAHPVESALLPGNDSGWRASAPGEQTLRLVFNTPQNIKTIMLKFEEPAVTRTQQYVLRWSGDAGQPSEIVRQQWNFSPDGASSENEIHHVELAGVKVLELSIIPNISGGDSVASLEELRIA